MCCLTQGHSKDTENTIDYFFYNSTIKPPHNLIDLVPYINVNDFSKNNCITLYDEVWMENVTGKLGGTLSTSTGAYQYCSFKLK